jgi:hypothetical protein
LRETKNLTEGSEGNKDFGTAFKKPFVIFGFFCSKNPKPSVRSCRRKIFTEDSKGNKDRGRTDHSRLTMVPSCPLSGSLVVFDALLC